MPFKKGYLSVEERRDFIVNCIYTDCIPTAVARRKTVSVRFSSSALDSPTEQFDMSDFCADVNHAILYAAAFYNRSDVDFLINYFGEDNIIFINRNEMSEMYANVFSISPNTILSDKKFVRLNLELKSKGFVVEEINYRQVSKMGGLFRCSTLPLLRR